MGKISRQQKAIAALIETGTIKEAASVAGVGQTTIFRWLQDPKFRRAYKDARTKLVEVAISQVQRACGEAVLVLQGIMNDRELSPGPRVSAARAVLEQAIKTSQLEDILLRLEKVEAKLKNRFSPRVGTLDE
jgi:phage terminase small subunit